MSSDHDVGKFRSGVEVIPKDIQFLYFTPPLSKKLRVNHPALSKVATVTKTNK